MAGAKREGKMTRRILLHVWMSLRDERGIETAEWIAILAVVLAIAFIVYNPTSATGGALGGALTGVVNSISTALTGLTP